MEPATSPSSQQTTQSDTSSKILFRFFMILCITMFALCIVYLIYQNGKSIYANGL